MLAEYAREGKRAAFGGEAFISNMGENRGGVNRVEPVILRCRLCRSASGGRGGQTGAVETDGEECFELLWGGAARHRT